MYRFFLTVLICVQAVFSQARQGQPTVQGGADAPAMTIWQLSNQSHCQMMSYVIRVANGQIIVIDGGTNADSSYLLKMIAEISGSQNPKVDAWFLTHCHGDHVYALATLINENRLPEVERFYFDFPSREWLCEHEPGSKNEVAICLDALEKLPAEKVVRTKLNQTLKFGPVTVTVLNDFDPTITNNAINNSSLALRFCTEKSSVLFLGDMGAESGKRLMRLQDAKTLKSDYVQMAHHGQSAVEEDLYKAIHPTVCLWPTTDWIWVNDGGKGPGTGWMKTEREKRWMADLGVVTHYNAKDGLHKIEIP